METLTLACDSSEYVAVPGRVFQLRSSGSSDFHSTVLIVLTFGSFHGRSGVNSYCSCHRFSCNVPGTWSNLSTLQVVLKPGPYTHTAVSASKARIDVDGILTPTL
jgi:hypothetical protein